MDRQSVIENNIVDRYLMGQLSETEAMTFEDFYAGSPETLLDLEQSATLIDSLVSSSRHDDIANVTTFMAKPKPQSRLAQFFSTPRYSVAASFLAIIALAFAGSAQMRLQNADHESLRAINIPVVTLSATRGGDSGIEIATAHAKQFVLALDLGLAEASNYTAALQYTNGELIWRAEGLVPDELQSLTMAVPSSLMPKGDYRIIVRPSDGQGQALLFPFTIVE